MLFPRSLTRPPATLLEDRAVAAYLGLAIGDALGATVEFMTPAEIRHQIGTHDQITGGGWLRLKPGQVTDDTTMALALGACILEQRSIEAMPIARALDNWMRAKPVDIGNTVRRNLLAFRRTGVAEAPCSEHDAGNGAAMRILPVALACHAQPADALRLACRVQGHITHHNPLSDAACETLALMVQALLHGATRDEAHALATTLLAGHPVFAFDRKRIENPSGYVVETLQAVFQAFFAHDNFEDCLIDIVNRGGDADTTGAIAGMLAGACYGLAGIPKRWQKALNPEISEHCQTQAIRLVSVL